MSDNYDYCDEHKLHGGCIQAVKSKQTERDSEIDRIWASIGACVPRWVFAMLVGMWVASIVVLFVQVQLLKTDIEVIKVTVVQKK